MALIYDPVLISQAEQELRHQQEKRIDAIDKLYGQHYVTVQDFERIIRHVHEQGLCILGPVTDEIAKRVTGKEHLLLGEDFTEDFFLRSQWLVENAVKMRQVYERHYRAAKNLAKIV